MKTAFLLLLFAVVSPFALAAQSTPVAAPSPLPENLYRLLRDSSDYVDVVFYPPYTSSMSLEGRNVRFFSNFIEPVSVVRQLTQKTGYISWLWRGRELVFADFYLAEKDAFIVVKIDGVEYVNRISQAGTQVLLQNARTK